MCAWRLTLKVALYSHCGHWNFWPSWIDFTCVWRYPLSVALYSHCGHWNLWPSWTDFTCFWRCPFWVALYSHCGHGNMNWLQLQMFFKMAFVSCYVFTLWTLISFDYHVKNVWDWVTIDYTDWIFWWYNLYQNEIMNDKALFMITREDSSLRIHNIIKHCLHYQVSSHLNQIDSDWPTLYSLSR